MKISNVKSVEKAVTYKIGNKTAIINCVFKEEPAPDINTILLKLMRSDIEKGG